MSNRILYAAWGALSLVCAVLGLVSLPTWVGLVAGLAFFVPPAMLMHRAHRDKNVKIIRFIRNLSLGWLAVTVVLLILNILSVGMTQTAGTVLYYLLAVLTVPMVCGGFWLLSIFLWACLLMTSLQMLKRKE